MKKRVHGQEVYYTLAWSPVKAYDRFSASRFLPELPGIVEIISIENGAFRTLMFLECWREGLRSGIKNLMEPDSPKFRDIRRELARYDIAYRYTEVNSSPNDLRDIMHWLIQATSAPFNNVTGFTHTGRYRIINVKEISRNSEDIIERIPPNA